MNFLAYAMGQGGGGEGAGGGLGCLFALDFDVCHFLFFVDQAPAEKSQTAQTIVIGPQKRRPRGDLRRAPWRGHGDYRRCGDGGDCTESEG